MRVKEYLMPPFSIYMKCLFLGLIVLFSIDILAQDPIVFIKESDLITTLSTRSSLATAVADINGDFRDDIIQIDSNKEFIYHIQLDEGTFYSHTPQSNPIGSDAYTLNVGDFDNSGHNDILNAGFYNGVAIANGSEGLGKPTIAKVSDLSFFSQGGNLFDINNDGWLDAYMTHDEGSNYVMMNDGEGNLLPQEWNDFQDIPTGSYGNYSAIWVDVDNDDDQDLYVAKCVVDGDTDPNIRDELYINENGRFIESGVSYGIDYMEQSWAVDAGDLDNDGDMDIVVISHTAAHYILENIDGQSFERHGLFDGIDSIDTPDLQVSIEDLNNDGLQDIIIGGVDDYILNNKGDLNFQIITNPFGTKRAATFALGDVNEDGYTDVLVGYLNPKDELWVNMGGGNHYATFSLSGTASNRSAIGAKLQLYGPWGIQTQWLNSGVGYGITNSLNVNFGLGSYQEIDSLVCLWPSGMREVFSELTIDKHYVITEGSCIEELGIIDYDDLRIDCDMDTIVLSLPLSKSDWQWNTGEQTNFIAVDAANYYSAKSSTDCRNVSQIVQVKDREIVELANAKLSLSGDIELCEGSVLPLRHNSTNDFIWSSGMTTDDIEIRESGEYFVFVDEDCPDSYSDTLIVEIVDFQLQNISDTIRGVIADTTLTVGVDNITWYQDSISNIILGSTADLEVSELDRDTNFYFTVDRIIDVPTIQAGPIADTLSLFYGSPDIAYSQKFEVLFPIVLQDCRVYAQVAGLRRILLISDNLDTLYSRNILLTQGYNTIIIDVLLPAGNYELLTGEEYNLSNIGQISPALHIIQNTNDTNAHLAGFVELDNSNTELYYFFDWNMKPYFESCTSEIYTYEIIYDRSVSTANYTESNFNLFPNPVSEFLYIESDSDIQKIDITDTQGRVVQTHDEPQSRLDLKNLNGGIYMISMYTDIGKFTKKIVKL